jgi:hypothetical protein
VTDESASTPSWSGNVLHGELQERNQREDRQAKRKVLILCSGVTIPPFTASLVDSPMMTGKHLC